MKNDINKYVRENFNGTHSPQVTCVDGFKMSVQASEYHYCTPRESYADEYSSMEIGFPSEEEELILEYMEGCLDDEPTDTVYPYVPVSVINEVLAKHGGIK